MTRDRRVILLAGWWLVLMGAWPLVPWSVHEAGGPLELSDYACHIVGIVMVLTAKHFRRFDKGESIAYTDRTDNDQRTQT